MRDIRFIANGEELKPETEFKVPNLDEVVNMKSGEMYLWRSLWVTDCTSSLFPTVCLYFAMLDLSGKPFL